MLKKLEINTINSGSYTREIARVVIGVLRALERPISQIRRVSITGCWLAGWLLFWVINHRLRLLLNPFCGMKKKVRVEGGMMMIIIIIIITS